MGMFLYCNKCGWQSTASFRNAVYRNGLLSAYQSKWSMRPRWILFSNVTNQEFFFEIQSIQTENLWFSACICTSHLIWASHLFRAQIFRTSLYFQSCYRKIFFIVISTQKFISTHRIELFSKKCSGICCVLYTRYKKNVYAFLPQTWTHKNATIYNIRCSSVVSTLTVTLQLSVTELNILYLQSQNLRRVIENRSNREILYRDLKNVFTEGKFNWNIMASHSKPQVQE